MIFDDIKNIKKYSEIDCKIADFIMNLDAAIPAGRIYLSDDGLTYANVDEYTTKTHDKCKLEAHRKYIDIQVMLDGVEELDYTDIEGLEVSEAYDETRDIVFFKSADRVLNKVVLESGKFIVLYPHEAHQPQMAYKNTPAPLKKVVVKIPLC